MQNSQDVAGEAFFTGETLLLWAAIALAVVFLALLVLDQLKRQRRRRRHRHGPEKLGAKLIKPVSRMRAFQEELKKLLHERSGNRWGHRHRRSREDRSDY